jgi:hypothetical protein
VVAGDRCADALSVRLLGCPWPARFAGSRVGQIGCAGSRLHLGALKFAREIRRRLVPGSALRTISSSYPPCSLGNTQKALTPWAPDNRGNTKPIRKVLRKRPAPAAGARDGRQSTHHTARRKGRARTTRPSPISRPMAQHDDLVTAYRTRLQINCWHVACDVYPGRHRRQCPLITPELRSRGLFP